MRTRPFHFVGLHRARRSAVAATLLLAGGWSAGATTILYVDAQNAGDPAQDGTPQHPFAQIQLAIDVAEPGDTIAVRPGRYRYINFLSKDIVVESTEGPTVTIIDGEDFAACVTIEFGPTHAAVLRGFQLTNADDVYGGGVSIFQASPTIAGNHIHNNTAHFGAGIDCELGDPIIVDNLIENNTATDFDLNLRHIIGDGGGISLFRSSGLIMNNIIRGNRCERRGGGIAIEGDTEIPIVSVVCVGNLLHGNFAEGLGGYAGGGGLSVRSNAAVTVSGCTITENAAVLGDGVHVTFPDVLAEFDSCIIYGNGASSLPDIRVDLAATASFQFSDIEGGQAGVQVASLGSATFGLGILDVDPAFVEQGADFSLAPCSALVNAGNPGYAPWPGEDSLDGAGRVSGDRVDIGAYELLYADCNANGVADACDIAGGTSADANQDGVPDECVEGCPGDVDGDGAIGLADLAILLTHFGTQQGATSGDGDLDGDGDVDLADLARLLTVFGSSCE